MSTEATAEITGRPQAPEPHERLLALDVLSGTWRLEGRDLTSGEAFTGTVTRTWQPGRFFLAQQTETDGHPDGGMEYIGYDSAADCLRSMLFSPQGPGPFCPFALEYFWEFDGDDLTIWHGFRNSPARFDGTIDPAKGTVTGAWTWPGGGYEATTTRVD